MKNNHIPSRILLSILFATLASCASTPFESDTKEDAPKTEQGKSSKDGGYYLDDGPGENAPVDIDSIPDAIPKAEPYSYSANRPYVALEKRYTPMTSYQPYAKVGIASWYGKRYHGKKTSVGEVYDMYGMTAAHPTLPVPSYARVINLSNGRSVVVRINDRGPFIDGRLIDLSYAAAYKLRMVDAGSAKVEVRAINASAPAASASVNGVEVVDKSYGTATSTVQTAPAPVDMPVAMPLPTEQHQPAETVYQAPIESQPVVGESVTIGEGFFLQVGAFKNDANSNQLTNRLQGFDRPLGVDIFNLYDGGVYRVKMGPYPTRAEAETAAAAILKQYQIKPIIQDQI